MIDYRQDRITKQIFRRAGHGSEEYIAKEKKWMVTSDAIEAFYDSSYSRRITEKEAVDEIERQLFSIENHF